MHDVQDSEKMCVHTDIRKVTIRNEQKQAASGDALAVNVATVGLIEGLKAYGNTLIRAFLGPVSLEEFETLVY